MTMMGIVVSGVNVTALVDFLIIINIPWEMLYGQCLLLTKKQDERMVLSMCLKIFTCYLIN